MIIMNQRKPDTMPGYPYKFRYHNLGMLNSPYMGKIGVGDYGKSQSYGPQSNDCLLRGIKGYDPVGQYIVEGVPQPYHPHSSQPRIYPLNETINNQTRNFVRNYKTLNLLRDDNNCHHV